MQPHFDIVVVPRKTIGEVPWRQNESKSAWYDKRIRRAQVLEKPKDAKDVDDKYERALCLYHVSLCAGRRRQEKMYFFFKTSYPMSSSSLARTTLQGDLRLKRLQLDRFQLTSEGTRETDQRDTHIFHSHLESV